VIRVNRATPFGRCASWLVIPGIMVVVLTTPHVARAQAAVPVRTPDTIKLAAPSTLSPAALRDFQARLDGYLALRATLAKRLKPLSSAASAAELAARQQALAAAIRAARPRAKPGDLLPPAVANYIKALVAADLQQRRPDEKAGAFEEVAIGPPPVINQLFPAAAALPTVPPLLLNAVPKLPDNLQYRFYDRHVVLLDGDTELIADYILNALPPLAKGDPDHSLRSP
jgi:hypothetical protein